MKRVLLTFSAALFLMVLIAGCGAGGSSGNSSTSSANITEVPPFPTMTSATLTWAPPASAADGSPLTNLAGYKIYYGTSSGNYTNVIDVGDVTSATVDNLPAGFMYYFTVTAYNSSGGESVVSNELSAQM